MSKNMLSVGGDTETPPLKDMLNLETLSSIADISKAHKAAKPFAHSVIDNFLNPDWAKRALADYDKINWQSYRHYNENKEGANRALEPNIAAVIDALNSQEFLNILTEITGIKNLIPDKELLSGGIHQSKRGGFLNIHADFTVHPYKKNYRRRINVLVYLNPEWDDAWGGRLELWNKDMSKAEQVVSPVFNRCVIFNTDEHSFHGHPTPMTCPDGVYRRSIALYYYTEEEEPNAVATNYQGRPDDGLLKQLLIWVDKRAVYAFHYLKSTFNIKDDFATRFMKKGKKKK